MNTITMLYIGFLMLLLISWLFISLIVYFIPVMVAFVRKHKNIFAIAVLNVVLGWTFFGWLAALLWALNSDTSKNGN